jgi:hypothetical protein
MKYYITFEVGSKEGERRLVHTDSSKENEIAFWMKTGKPFILFFDDGTAYDLFLFGYGNETAWRKSEIGTL